MGAVQEPHASSTASLNAKAREAWNDNAAVWDEARLRGLPFQEMLIEPAMLRMLGLVDGMAIIDAGCGNGQLARGLADLGARITAFDFAEELIARARARSAEYGDLIDYHVIDATAPAQLAALPEGAFNAVTCSQVLMDMTVIEPLIAAAHGWLVPEGVFVFSVSHPCFNSGTSALMAESIEDPPGEIRTVRSVKVSGYKSVVPFEGVALRGQPSLQLYVDRPLESLLGAFFTNGFVMDAIEEPAFPDQTDAPLLHWRGMSEIPPVLVVRMRKA